MGPPPASATGTEHACAPKARKAGGHHHSSCGCKRVFVPPFVCCAVCMQLHEHCMNSNYAHAGQAGAVGPSAGRLAVCNAGSKRRLRVCGRTDAPCAQPCTAGARRAHALCLCSAIWTLCIPHSCYMVAGGTMPHNHLFHCSWAGLFREAAVLNC